MLEFVMVVVVVGALVVLLAPRIRRMRGAAGAGGSAAHMAEGTLLVTGVSAGPDSDGSQHVTISGVINGPTVREHAIYARMVMPVGTSPTMGEVMPVVYSPKNPDKWGFVPPESPELPNYPPSSS